MVQLIDGQPTEEVAGPHRSGRSIQRALVKLALGLAVAGCCAGVGLFVFLMVAPSAGAAGGCGGG
jgi:hypothetical protein